MTIDVRSGTTGSIVPIKPRYESVIGGDWVKPVKRSYAEALAPATALPIAEYARSAVEDVGLAVRETAVTILVHP